MLHDEPHTLGYPGRGRSFVRDNAESVIPLHPLDEQQIDPTGSFIPRSIPGDMGRCEQLSSRIIRTGFGKEDSTYAKSVAG
jgi:hypothetical protein